SLVRREDDHRRAAARLSALREPPPARRVPVPAAFLVVLPPRDDVARPLADLLVAPGAPVHLHGVDRLDCSHLPPERRRDRRVRRDRALFVCRLAAPLGTRAPRRHASAPPSITIVDPVT